MSEPLDVDKIHRVIQWAAEGLQNVKVSKYDKLSQPVFASNDVRYSPLGFHFHNENSNRNRDSFAPACFIDERPVKFKLRIILSKSKQQTTQLVLASKRLARSPPINSLLHWNITSLQTKFMPYQIPPTFKFLINTL